MYSPFLQSEGICVIETNKTQFKIHLSNSPAP